MEQHSAKANSLIPFAGLLLTLFLFLLGYYWPWLSNHASFYMDDLQFWWHPFLTFMSRAVSNGHMALWNPYLVCIHDGDGGIAGIIHSIPCVFWILQYLSSH